MYYIVLYDTGNRNDCFLFFEMCTWRRMKNNWTSNEKVREQGRQRFENIKKKKEKETGRNWLLVGIATKGYKRIKRRRRMQLLDV